MTVSELTSLDAATITEVGALLEAATEADGTAPVGEHVLRGLFRPGTHLRAALDGPDGGLVGYAQLDGGTAELAVHPAARRRGVGTALLGALTERRPDVRVWAHGGLPAAVELAGKLGWRQVRALWQMHRGLLEPPLAEPVLPEGVRLRPFVVGRDEAEFLRVNNAAFDWHPEQGGWGPAQIAEGEAQPWFDPAGFLLAVQERDDTLLGYHWTKTHSGTLGEVYVLGVDPAAQGRKLGAALTLAGLHHLRDRGLTDVLLYVESDNDAAIRVYEKLGFSHRHTDISYEPAHTSSFDR